MDREVLQQQFGMIGKSKALMQVIDKVRQAAPTDITILLQGESGVGKDVTARTIHHLSKRKREELVLVNCGAIPEGIIESELFGHEKGAFTGAQATREGYFEKANHGTIFLDEIGDMPLNVQVKLLRVLESGEYFRVGSSKLMKTDVRVVAATNKDLWTLVQKGKFREDLFYRLDMISIRIPPLRERPDDIPDLFKKFVTEFAAKYDSVFQGFSDEAKKLLISYRWPGNIRELRNVAEQLVVLEKSNYVDVDVLKKYLKGRQHLAQADNLPALVPHQDSKQQQETHNSNFSDNTNTGYSSSNFNPSSDMAFLYKAILDMKGEMSDVKKMVANLMYSNNMQPSNYRNFDRMLPASNRPEVYSDSERDISVHSYPSVGKTDYDADNDEEINEQDFLHFFGEDNIPSIVDAEKYLIELALEKFDGNRRKASEVLGISERTLYRKLDQYGLE